MGLQDLVGAQLVHFAPENGLSVWLDRARLAAGVRAEPVMRTAVTTAAPQLAAAGLGVAVTPEHTASICPTTSGGSTTSDSRCVRSASLFVVAALFEIGGAWLVWQGGP